MTNNEQSTPKVSIIVPVYRSLEHIQETISCLQNQTLKELEFIFVDDKGGDGTFDIVKEAAKSDPRIVCLENEVNSGPGVARNKGIEAARGEFIAFVDADDLLSPNFYEKLYAKAKETGALVVKGQRCILEADGTEIPSTLNQRIKDGLHTADSMLPLWHFEHTTGIFSRELILKSGARNCETARRDQDTCFLMMLMIHVTPAQFAMDESVTYYYVQHEASLIHKPKNAYYMEQMRLSAEFKINFMLEHLTTMEHAQYLAGIINSRLSAILDSVRDGDVEEEYITSYIKYFAEVLIKWQASDLPYVDSQSSALLRKLHYVPMAFYAIRNWYSELNNEFIQLRRERNLIILAPYLKRQIRKLKFKKLFSFGAKRKEYKQTIRLYKTKLLECKALKNAAMNQFFT